MKTKREQKKGSITDFKKNWGTEGKSEKDHEKQFVIFEQYVS